ncbi:MAG TPA: monovalent cation/H+ antiporter complex subunit F [Ilumatobacteraceae bacterium]
MSAWFIASLALLIGMVPLLIVLERTDTVSRLIALETLTVMTALVLLTLAEAFGRSFYAMLALILALTSVVGSPVYARFLERYL